MSKKRILIIDALEAECDVFDISPELAWEKYADNPEELKKREHLWVTNPVYAYRYARHVLKEPFPLGEAAIASSPEYAYAYARWVLKKPFPLGEKAIASHPDYAYLYALDVLKKPFPLGEAAIASHPDYAYRYAREVLEKNSKELTLFLLKHGTELVK